MIRMFLFLIGFGLSVIGFVYIILYLNYMTIGYTFFQYLQFIITRFECLLSLMGISIISIVLFMKGDKNDIYI